MRAHPEHIGRAPVASAGSVAKDGEPPRYQQKRAPTAKVEAQDCSCGGPIWSGGYCQPDGDGQLCGAALTF